MGNLKAMEQSQKMLTARDLKRIESRVVVNRFIVVDTYLSMPRFEVSEHYNIKIQITDN
jgi:hypothetical protein